MDLGLGRRLVQVGGVKMTLLHVQVIVGQVRCGYRVNGCKVLGVEVVVRVQLWGISMNGVMLYVQRSGGHVQYKDILRAGHFQWTPLTGRFCSSL